MHRNPCTCSAADSENRACSLLIFHRRTFFKCDSRSIAGLNMGDTSRAKFRLPRGNLSSPVVSPPKSSPTSSPPPAGSPVENPAPLQADGDLPQEIDTERL
ncbi:hypothetical protein K456DRAFT_1935640 [Colletotrichum gloeosporioides 23]|nr:hypothetical protein K456DRAFT_1935640 [Colletotrichum gloeosporioides 23]